MKVLVYFKQDFFTDDERILGKLRVTENICKVFEAKSNDDLVIQFKNYNFVPKYLQDLDIVKHSIKRSVPKIEEQATEENQKDLPKIEPPEPIKFIADKKTMMWFLPENGTPYIEGELCAA